MTQAVNNVANAAIVVLGILVGAELVERLAPDTETGRGGDKETVETQAVSCDNPLCECDPCVCDPCTCGEPSAPAPRIPHPAPSIDWHTSIDEARRAAAGSDGRPVLVYWTQSSCAPCARLEQTLWADERVAAAVSANYVAVAIDAAREPRLARRWNVRTTPRIDLVEPDWSSRRRVTPDELRKALGARR